MVEGHTKLCQNVIGKQKKGCQHYNDPMINKGASVTLICFGPCIRQNKSTVINKLIL